MSSAWIPSADVAGALLELGAAHVPGDAPQDAANRLRTHLETRPAGWQTTIYDLHSARALVHSLDAGDLASADRCAEWFVRPGDAMARALAEINAAHTPPVPVAPTLCEACGERPATSRPDQAVNARLCDRCDADYAVAVAGGA